jgi:hypothetical protein
MIVDETPFFLSTDHSLHPNNLVASGSEELFGVGDTNKDSENDDLRGVIDDLTVENKRLKSLLKSQRPRSTPSQTSRPKDRLFELRVHGLPADKKRELENLLHNFATTVREPQSAQRSSAPRNSGRPHTKSDPSIIHNVGQSKPVHTDSGYASNSGSGQTSAHVSAGGNNPVPLSKSSRNNNVRSYLHDIPDTLLSGQSLFMTERAKMVLVVRRLEELFTGKLASPGDHSQPIQQQEVSNSAAHADATSQNRPRTAEGTREAHMLPQDSKVNLDAVQKESSPQKPSASQQGGLNSSNTALTSLGISRPGSPDQRPTRPLDLDIHRAQVAADNIQYLRHLGQSSPHINATMDLKDPSWMYLNLLINMAQLHTINVTPSFIRRAIRKLSSKFELSSDGSQVRWKGGSEGTKFSREDDREMEVTHTLLESSDDLGRSSSNNRSKATSSSNNNTSDLPSSRDKSSGLATLESSKPQISTSATSNLPISMPKTTTGSSFDYQPMFYKGPQKYTAQESYLDPTSSSYSSEDSSGLARALSKSTLRHRSSDDGMITFYNNPYFCRDASADNVPINWKPMREVLSWDTLGIEHDLEGESPLRHHDACYFTPQFAAKPYSDKDEPLLAFNPASTVQAGEDETYPIELQVSGLGGVYPEDNLAIDVKVGRKLEDEIATSERMPFTGTRKRKRYSYRTLRAEQISLQPSKLPPPSYVFFTSSSSSNSYDRDDSGSETSSSADEERPAPAGFLHTWDSTSSDGDADGDQSSDIDMLAMARAADPDRIANAEREYIIDNPNAMGRIEGSLAATVGASCSSSSDGRENIGGSSDEAEDGDGSASEMDVDDD